jgi:hypothetical protein
MTSSKAFAGFFHILEYNVDTEIVRVVDTVKITPGDSVQLQFSINMLRRRYYELLQKSPSDKVGMFGLETDQYNSWSSLMVYFDIGLSFERVKKEYFQYALSFRECVRKRKPVILKKALEALGHHTNAAKTCLLKSGTIQNDDTLCWMHSVINGLLRGAYLSNEMRCMVSKYVRSLSPSEMSDFHSDKGTNVCPKDADKNGVLKIISKFMKQDKISTLHIKGLLKVLKIRTNPLYVAPGWYADSALQKILRALDIPFYETTDHDRYLSGQKMTESVDANVIVVHTGRLTRCFKPKKKIPESLTLAGKLYKLDHACVVLKNNVQLFSHFMAAILPKPGCFEEGFLYGLEADHVIPFNWMNPDEDTTTLLNTYLTIPLGPVTSYEISYVMYVSQLAFSCEIDSDSIKTDGVSGGGKSSTPKAPFAKWISTGVKNTQNKLIWQNTQTHEKRIKMMVMKGSRKHAVYKRY